MAQVVTYDGFTAPASTPTGNQYDSPPSSGLPAMDKGFIAGGVILFVLSWTVYIWRCSRNRSAGSRDPALGLGLPRERARTLGLREPYAAQPSFPAPAYNHSGRTHHQSGNYGYDQVQEERRRQNDRRREEEDRQNQYSYNNSRPRDTGPNPFQISAARDDAVREASMRSDDQLRAEQRARDDRAFMATYDASYR